MKRERTDWREKAKQSAAREAVKHVESGFILGLGSGSTVAYAAKEIGRRIRREKLKVWAVPTSYQAFFLAIENKIPLTSLHEHPEIDLTIDGADQIDKQLNMIKGRGGALTREKILASASKKVIIVADETKLTEKLGMNCPVPIEVLPFALPYVANKIKELGGKPVLRRARNKVGPVVTDNGNFITDTDFGIIDEPEKLQTKLKEIPGVVETGLFINIADIVFVGRKEEVKQLTKVKK